MEQPEHIAKNWGLCKHCGEVAHYCKGLCCKCALKQFAEYSAIPAKPMLSRAESDRRVRDWLIRQESSAAINRWIDENIDENGNAVFPYVYKISRAADIADIIRDATKKVDQMDRSKFSLSYDGPDHFILQIGDDTKRCSRELFP